MTHLTSGTTFAVCLILALTADSWADKPLLALVGAGISLAVAIALTGLARGRKRPSGATNTRRSTWNRKYAKPLFLCYFSRL